MFNAKPFVFDYSPYAILADNWIIMLPQVFDNDTVFMSRMQQMLNVPIETNKNQC